jgi:hypothetical protein
MSYRLEGGKMRRAILFFFLFAVLFSTCTYAEPAQDTGGVSGGLARHSESPAVERYQLAQAGRGDEVSSKLPFNFLNGIYMSRCMESARSGDFGPAIEACSKAIELDPGNLFAHRLRGLAHAKSGDSRKAAQDCEAAEKLGDRECRSWLKQAMQEESDKKTLRLLCRVSFANGPARDYPVTVDLAAGTVNGWKAKITEDTIYWTQGNTKKREEVWFRIDRYTGTFQGANTDDRAPYAGKCAKVADKKQF